MRRTFFAAVLAAVFLLSGLQTTRAVTGAVSLQAPTNLQAMRNNAGAIVLTWMDNSTGELGYKVERKVSTAPFAEIFRGTTPNQMTFTDDPQLGALYQYRVRAYASGMNGPYSNVAAVTLPIPPSATPTPRPSAPAPTLSVDDRTPDSTTASFRLEVPVLDNPYRTYFVLQRSVNGAAFADVPSGIFAGLGGRTFLSIDDDLPPNATLRYRARAVVLDETASPVPDSNIVTISTMLRAPDPVSATAGTTGGFADYNTIIVRYTDTNQNPRGYQVERKTGASGTFELVGEGGNTADNAFIEYFDNTETPARPNTTYIYRVRAFRTEGTTTIYGPYSREVAARFTLPASVLSSDYQYSTDGTAASFTLLVHQTGPDSNFVLQRSVNGGGFTKIADVIYQFGSSSGFHYSAVDPNLQNGKTYRYRAVDTSGAVPTSNVFTITTPNP